VTVPGGPPDVVSIGDIAAMAAVSKERARQLMDRRTHPGAPEGRQTAAGEIWDRPAVIAHFVALGRVKTWED
jgi:hypothetical protein